MGVRFQSIGCGDAFASLGNYQSAHLLHTDSSTLLLDCGATILNSLEDYKVDPNDIDIIAISHFHGDHIGGIPFLLLKSVYVLQREKPLTIIGPVGLINSLLKLIDAMYNGNGDKMLNQEFLSIVELETGNEFKKDSMTIELFEADHGNAQEAKGIQVNFPHLNFLYSGDTEINEVLLSKMKESDYALLECTSNESIKGHLDKADIIEILSKCNNLKRVWLTHKSEPISINNVLVENLIEGEIYEI